MANLVSLIRTLLGLLVVGLLFIQTQSMYWICFVLTIVVISMDALDGYLARKFNETSKMGAVIDILGDRIVEQVYWVTFLALGWLPLWVPLVVIVRGIVVDGLRSMALEQGFTAFGQSSMQQSKLGWLLVSSNFSRTTYAVAKAAAFAFMILGHTPGFAPDVATPITGLGLGCTYISVAFCVIRGLPVLIEGRRFLSDDTKPAAPSA
ncbi:CDP-alcohol phosphatidyltransferase family protein [Vampirovibrio chlorellavorus]|uniref:CDP-alcohol phosphatidyltransferase family protein n=1 Tax=Vampirovibrio chlorellavorus TaxID=758823 RepID=UPI0026EF2E33|nr:CDP-alcohol phosphatidyltransferase family protein [Vampirovibrio chlorellavorus]